MRHSIRSFRALQALAAHSALALLAAACSSAPPPAAPAPAPAADTAPPPARPTPDSALLGHAVAPPPVPRAPVRLSFTGDINLGTRTLPDGVPPDSGRRFLAAARAYLVGDLVIGNFEGVLGDSGTSSKCIGRTMCYAFQTPTVLAPRLAEAGFTHLNLANNHANDYGVPARLETEARLGALGLRVYGPLGLISVDSVRRGDSVTVVGLIGFTTYPYAYNLLDIAASAALVDSVRASVDLLIVTFHGGTEGTAAVRTGAGPEFLGREPRGDLRRWARAVIDAGADAVIGHGPHVLRGIEFYRGRPIAYSLGNFATYRGFSIAGPLGITGVLQLAFDGERRLDSARVVPMIQRPRAGPQLDAEGAAIRLLRTLSIQDFGPTAARITDDGRILPPPGEPTP